MIRTLDPHVPNVVRYQTALHSVTSGASIEQGFRFDKRKISKKFAILGKVPVRREIFLFRWNRFPALPFGRPWNR